MKHISVIGLGYIGLPTAIISAQHDYFVYGFDINESRIDKINNYDPVILEYGIKERLSFVLQKKHFKAYKNLYSADCFIIAVPTPFLEKVKEKKADLSYVFSAAKSVASVLKKGNLVILESTVPVGTTTKISRLLERESGLVLSRDFFVAHCPERVLPGKIFEELVSNDRVIGGVCQKSTELAKSFYSRFVKGQIYITDDKTAEFVKLIENSYRDLNIAFANEVALMAEQKRINPFYAIEIANKHPRVNILNPGCGVGGHCIAVDPWFLIQSFPKNSKTIKAARIINDKQPDLVIKNVLEKIKILNFKKPKILVLGITFKPDVDDLRGSPALKIAQALNNKKELLDLAVYEPNVSYEILKANNLKNFDNLRESIYWADFILILVGHSIFYEIKNIDLNEKFVIDVCGLFYKMKKNNNFVIKNRHKDSINF